jgi:hypothetical protein
MSRPIPPAPSSLAPSRLLRDRAAQGRDGSERQLAWRRAMEQAGFSSQSRRGASAQGPDERPARERARRRVSPPAASSARSDPAMAVQADVGLWKPGAASRAEPASHATALDAEVSAVLAASLSSPARSRDRQPPRVHADAAEEGVRVWVGADRKDALALERSTTALVQLLGRWAAARGTRLVSVVCNGRALFVHHPEPEEVR